jgi:hypothetical protein
LSIQETINEAKKELNNDEQMLASAFKLEKFYKKHKIKIFSVVALAALYFGGTAVMNTIAEQKLLTANDAYLTLKNDPKNERALTELKTNNPKLFELYSYQEALKTKDTATLKTLSSSNNEFIADLSAYHLAILEGKPAESELQGDIAHVNNAYLLIQDGKVTLAKEELELIPEESPVYNISKMIKHYSVKGQ